MIVTCPGCASKYRVRNEAVPPEGARMRCPKCETLFLAKPPVGGSDASNDDASAAPAAPVATLPPQGASPFAASVFGAPSAPPSAAAPLAPSFGGRAPTPMSAPAAGFPFGAAPAPFGAAPAPFAAAPAPFGAAPAPFGAAPGPFAPSSPQPFGAPASPTPFGMPSGSVPFGAQPGTGSFPSANSGAPTFAAPTSPPQASPFATPFQPAPVAPKTAGPVTSMLQQFDESLLPPPQTSSSPGTPPPSGLSLSSQTPRPAGDDPFMNLDIGPSTSSGVSSSVSTMAPDRPRPKTQTPTSAPTQASSASPPTRPQMRGDSMVGVVGSWIALVTAIAATGAGLTFAGWTSESLNLDHSLMPVFEQNFGVHPPRSFLGVDDVALDELRHQAQTREAAGDLSGALVAWRRVQARDATDKTATTAIPRVQTALGERLR